MRQHGWKFAVSVDDGPFYHVASRESAETQAMVLARSNKGKQVDTYEFVSGAWTHVAATAVLPAGGVA